MVESGRRVQKKEQNGVQNPLLSNILERTDFNKSQQRAIGIIRQLDITPEQQALLFLYSQFHKRGSLATVKDLTGITNDRYASLLIDKVLESDELTEKYEIFYNQYLTDDKDDD